MKNLLIVIALVFVWSGTASAHTALSKSTPADGEALTEPPASIQLEFTESVRLLRADLMLMHDDSSQNVDIDFEPSAAAAKRHSVNLPNLANGQYRIEWAVVGADGHPVRGEFAFGINMAPANAANLKTQSHGAH